MRRIPEWLLVLLLLALGAPLAAQTPGAPLGRRRDRLEAQLLQRFTQQAGRELRLAMPEQARLGRVVQEVAAARRELNLAALDLRRRLSAAVRDTTISDARLEQLLTEQRALRQREHDLWQREQQRLQQVLTPRQRVHFALLWLRLQDDARGLMMQRGRVPLPPGGLNSDL